MSVLALAAAVAAVVYAKKQARVAEYALEESKRANASADEVARKQLQLSTDQHLEILAPNVEIMDWEIEGPSIARNSNWTVEAPADGDPFDAVRHCYVDIGYRVVATIANVGQRHVRLLPLDRLTFLTDPSGRFTVPEKVSDVPAYILLPGDRARFRWDPSLPLKDWMDYYVDAEDVVLKVLCSTDKEAVSQVTLRLEFDAEPVHPQKATFRQGRVERDEVREQGVDQYVWVWSRRRSHIAVKQVRRF